MLFSKLSSRSRSISGRRKFVALIKGLISISIDAVRYIEDLVATVSSDIYRARFHKRAWEGQLSDVVPVRGETPEGWRKFWKTLKRKRRYLAIVYMLLMIIIVDFHNPFYL